MFWYVLALVLAMLFASAAEKLKGRDDLDVDGGTFYYRSSYRWMAVLSFLPLFLVAAMRHEVGTDWPIYIEYYGFINEGTKSFSEVLFNLMNRLVGLTIGDFQAMVVLVAFMSYIFLFKAIYDQSISAPLSLLVFFISCLYFTSLNQLRQAISMPIMLYAFKHVLDRKPFSYLFWGIIATLIHASSMVYLPVYFIVKFRPSIRRYVTIFGLCIVSLPALQALFGFIFKFTKYAWYSTSAYNSGQHENNFYLIGFVFQFVLLVIMCYYRFSLDEEDAIYDSMLNCYFLSVVLLLFTPVISQTLRISVCFGYYQILLVPRMINREKDRTRRIVLYMLVVGLYAVKLLYDTYVLGWNDVIPYQTFFTR